MSLYKTQLRQPSAHLTIKDCDRSQSSRSSLSDLAWSGSSAMDRPDSARGLLGRDSLNTPSALLEDYDRVFTQMNELREAVDELIGKVERVFETGTAGAQDSVHGRLFMMLREKISDLGRQVEKSGLCESGALRQRRELSVSTFKAKARETSTSKPNPALERPVNKSTASVRITKRNTGISPAINTEFTTPEKRKARFSVRSECNATNNAPTTSSLNVAKPRPAETLVSAIDLRLESATVTEDNSQSDKKLNYFDTIAGLMKLNFIDHEQVVTLKKYVIKRDQRVLKPLRVYEANRDLQVLISNIGALLESCERNAK